MKNLDKQKGRSKSGVTTRIQSNAGSFEMKNDV